MTPLAFAYAFVPTGGKPELFLERGRAELRASTTTGVLHHLWNHPPIDDRRLRRAVEIADEAMMQVVRDHCVMVDEVGRFWSLPDGPDLSSHLHDAIAWLGDRQLITMTPEATIVLLDNGAR